MKVSVIGLGAMGSAIAANICRAGHELSVWNRSEAAAAPLEALGAKRLASAADAFSSPVVLSMLADDSAVDTLVTETVLQGASKGCIHVNLATVSLACAERMKALHAHHGVAYISAPVFGRTEVAVAGKLNIVAAGDASALAVVQPLFESISQKVWPVGTDPTHAIMIKITGNMMLAATIATLGEAMVMLEHNGVAPQTFTDIMSATLFASPAFGIYANLLNAGRFEPAAFKLRLGLKDVGLALATVQQGEDTLPLVHLISQQFKEAVATGHGDSDWSYLGEHIRRKAGLPGR
jgi:3-hydroxyisobutyrate dehydrogenase-like beta-hydroxyacid dehydrogenase